MLRLFRKENQIIVCGGPSPISITVLSIRPGRVVGEASVVELGIQAPNDVTILRGELLAEGVHENQLFDIAERNLDS